MTDDATQLAKFYRAILERLESGVAVMRAVRGADGEIVDFQWVLANEYTARVIGLPETELVGRNLLELIPAQVATGAFERYRRVMETGEPDAFAVVLPDGVARGVYDVTATRLLDGVVIAYSDITEETRRWRAAEEVSDRLEVATRSAGIGVWEQDLETHKTTWDAMSRAIYGVDPDVELTYADWRALVHPDDLPALEASSATITSDPPVDHGLGGRFRIVRASDGAVRHVQTFAQVIVGKGRSRLVGVNWDVTEEVEAATELEIKRREAEAANVAKSQFLAVMSHEIRTPLNAMLGMAAVLEQSALSDLQRDLLRTITDAGDELLEILNGILDLSRVEAGQLTLEESPFDLGAVLRQAEALFRARAGEKGLSLQLNRTATASGSLIGDPTRVRQILYNLLSNAVKFTSRGEIEISADVRARPADEPDAHELVLAVRDTGIGISAEKLDTIFRPFAQADSSMTRLFGGAGLGLSVALQFAKLMGGTISVQSKLGEGSVFTARIPTRRAALELTPVRRRQRLAVPTTSGRRLKILAAEDNEISRVVLQALLSDPGLELTVVEHGLEAIKAWAAGAYDAIILDMQMPVMDGPSTAREIRRLEAETGRLRAPIVAVSANAMAHHVQQCLDAGMDAHVSKPFKGAELLETILRLVNGRAAALFDEERRTAS